MPKKPQPLLKPYWTAGTERDCRTVKLYHGNAMDVLYRLPPKSVHCVVTSPPYWGLRDYGQDKQLELGSEATSAEFICRMVNVFKAVHHVLRDDGTLWLNLGDTYKNGGLMGVPWRVALALQSNRWVLRQDIIWHKPSPMPESTRNRCTRAHEYLFLLTKEQRYYYDAEAIREESKGVPCRRAFRGGGVYTDHRAEASNHVHHPSEDAGLKRVAVPYRNRRDVWTIASQGYKGAHFATFPEKLVEPCILAGTSEYGCCSVCGAPWQRITKRKQIKRSRPNDYVKRTGAQGTGNVCANSVAGVAVETLGWQPTCGCGAEVVPCVVLDPFVGSGTTAAVAVRHGRRAVGIDLSEQYLRENAVPRISKEFTT